MFITGMWIPLGVPLLRKVSYDSYGSCQSSLHCDVLTVGITDLRVVVVLKEICLQYSCVLVSLCTLQRPQELPTQTATGSAHLANKCRILLCAPSNAAVDELIGQIAKARMCLDKRQDNKENRRPNRQSLVKKGWKMIYVK